MSGKRNASSAGKLSKAEKSAQVLELRKAGASYRAIARQVGISEAYAHRLVHEQLSKLAEKTGDDATAVRHLELARLDEMLLGVWPQARKGHHQAVASALRIMERRAKVVGIDAPVKHAHTDPTGNEERAFPVAFPVPPTLDPEAWQAFAAQAAKGAQGDG